MALLCFYCCVKDTVVEALEQRSMNRAARRMGLALNSHIFKHPLNRMSIQHKDPRNCTQKQQKIGEATTTASVLELNELECHSSSTIGFVPVRKAADNTGQD